MSYLMIAGSKGIDNHAVRIIKNYKRIYTAIVKANLGFSAQK